MLGQRGEELALAQNSANKKRFIGRKKENHCTATSGCLATRPLPKKVDGGRDQGIS